jgi:hypothetical protein
MIRYLLYPFIINYLHIYLFAPYLIYIGRDSIIKNNNAELNKHYRILMILGGFIAIYHMKLLWDRCIAIVGFIFLLIAIVEYLYIFRDSYLLTDNLKKIKKSKFNL